MNIFVKTLGTHFEIQVNPQDTVEDVKRNIESVQGPQAYPAPQKMIIHQGKVLKDGTTLEVNKVQENTFVVVMLSKSKSSADDGSARSAAPTVKAPETSVAPTPSAFQPVTITAAPPASVPLAAPAVAPSSVAAASESDVFDQAVSNLVAGSNLEGTIEQIIDMGGGTWDRETVVRSLRAAFNNPERAVEYLCTGIPAQAEVPPVVARAPASAPAGGSPAQRQPATPAAVPTSGPNANPLDLFPQGLPNMGGSNPANPGDLDFLRNTQQFQALRAMVQANLQILQSMLQELGKQNPNLMRLIQEHQADFLRLVYEPVEGGEGNILEQLGDVMPQSVTVTPEESEAIERWKLWVSIERLCLRCSLPATRTRSWL